MKGTLEVERLDGNNIYLNIKVANDKDLSIKLISYNIRFYLNYIDIGNMTGFKFNTSNLGSRKTEHILTIKFYLPPDIFDLVDIERERLGGIHTNGSELELLFYEENEIKNESVSLSDFKMLGYQWLTNTLYTSRQRDIIKRLIIETNFELKKIHKDILYYAIKHGLISQKNTFDIDIFLNEFRKYIKKEIDVELKYLKEYGYMLSEDQKDPKYYISDEKIEEIKKVTIWYRRKDIFFYNIYKFVIIIGIIIGAIIYLDDIISLIKQIIIK